MDEAEQRALVVQDERRARVLVTESGIEITNLTDFSAFAEMVIASGLAPKGMSKASQVVIAVQAGLELGFTPMRALGCITVINGRAGIMGDAAKALIEGKGCLEPGTTWHVTYSGTEGKDDYTCRVSAHKKGAGEVASEFSVGDAKKASLWGKSGPWASYPKRMLMYRALGFLVRDYFSEVLHGFAIVEEVSDIRRAPESPPRAEPPAGADPLLAARDVTPKPEPEVDPDTGEVIPDSVREPEQQKLA